MFRNGRLRATIKSSYNSGAPQTSSHIVQPSILVFHQLISMKWFIRLLARLRACKQRACPYENGFISIFLKAQMASRANLLVYRYAMVIRHFRIWTVPFRQHARNYRCWGRPSL